MNLTTTEGPGTFTIGYDHHTQAPSLNQNGTPLDEYKGREMHIRPLHYGYTVQVGCTTVCIETKERLIEKLIAYFNNPKEIEEKFFKGELFR